VRVTVLTQKTRKTRDDWRGSFVAAHGVDRYNKWHFGLVSRGHNVPFRRS
jgi:hypothetical protein